jgi:hypothetical protein
VVLPTFLQFIPRGRVGHPQLFPKRNGADPQVHRNIRSGVSSSHRHTARIVGVICLLAGVPLLILAYILPTSDHAGAGQSDWVERVEPAYYEPPPLTNPAQPGTVIASGSDLPDAFVLVDQARYFLFTSSTGTGVNVPVRSSTNIGQWGPVTDALPKMPAWAGVGLQWAPDVRRFGDHYVLYFTAATNTKGAHPPLCIGDAYGSSPAGPYVAAPKPLICQLSQGGSIDPRTFVDPDGQSYVIWKSDNNSNPKYGDTHIYSQRLSTDGLSLVGTPTLIFHPDEHWQGAIVEAPQLVLVKGSYWLFYSGFEFYTAEYAIGAARCAGPLGPCKDTQSTPLLASNAQGAGPGEESLFADNAGIYMVYAPFHYWPGQSWTRAAFPRPVEMAHIGFGPTGPYLATP